MAWKEPELEPGYSMQVAGVASRINHCTKCSASIQWIPTWPTIKTQNCSITADSLCIPFEVTLFPARATFVLYCCTHTFIFSKTSVIQLTWNILKMIIDSQKVTKVVQKDPGTVTPKDTILYNYSTLKLEQWHCTSRRPHSDFISLTALIPLWVCSSIWFYHINIHKGITCNQDRELFQYHSYSFRCPIL